METTYNLEPLLNTNQTPYDMVYPLVIICDRYTGIYSGGKFTAWNCDLDEVPMEIEGDDTECMEFWWHSQLNPETYIVCGVGNTPDEAAVSLANNLKHKEDEEDMAYTEASKKATNKWIKNNYDKICVTLPKGQRDVWKQSAEKHGMSLNAFIKHCVEKNL